jgi:hypothetical protein
LKPGNAKIQMGGAVNGYWIELKFEMDARMAVEEPFEF